MRHGITIGRRIGSKHLEVLTGPEVPLPEQIAAFKRLKADPAAASTFEEIELWNAGQGRAKRHRFRAASAMSDPSSKKPKTK